MTGLNGQSDCNNRQDGLCAEYQEQAEPWQIYSGILNPMYGSNRLIIVALGLALFAIGAWTQRAAIWADGPSAYPEYRETGEDAQKRLSLPTLQQASKSVENQQPCRNPQGHDASDLCAQWRAADAAQRAARWAWWQMVFSLTGIVGLVVTLWFNFAAWDQARKSKRDTDKALGHAEESAKAMQAVADTLQSQSAFVAQNTETNRQIADSQQKYATLQLRAYISVKIGHAIFQDREGNLRFEAKPTLVNSGQTAAKSITHRIRAAILPSPLPDSFEFETAPIAGRDGFIPPHEDRIISAVVDDFIDDGSVHHIMARMGRGLYVWGKITYTDEFDIERETIFGQSLFWIPNSKEGEGPIIMGNYIPGMNNAT